VRTRSSSSDNHLSGDGALKMSVGTIGSRTFSVGEFGRMNAILLCSPDVIGLARGPGGKVGWRDGTSVGTLLCISRNRTQ
jgi:hypothetical protein